MNRQLAARGFRVQTVDLPSVADGGGPRFGLFDDADVVRQRLEEIDGPVVVVAHSYGGAVVSQAAAGLPNVRHLIYVCAFQLDIGESVLGVVGAAPDWWVVEDDILMPPDDSQALFFHDVPHDAAEWAVSRLQPFSLKATRQPLTAAAWHTIPSTYIVTEEDMAIPHGQDFLATRATYVRHLSSGHIPQLSMPSALTELIVEAADRTESTQS